MLRSFLVFLLFVEPSSAEVIFEPVEVKEHVYDGGWEHFVGGGVAVFDCDGDQYSEVFAAGGENQAQLFRNRSNGAIELVEDTPSELAISGVIGAYPLDVDSDGILDLAVLRVGPDQLLKGLGSCKFAPFSTLNFDIGDHWTTAFSATWEGENKLPTLAFGTYVNRSDPDGPFEACDHTLLYRPGKDAYSSPQFLDPGYCALSALFSDWNRTGRADLRLSNDRHYFVRDGGEQLWAMEQRPRLYSSEDGWEALSIWGMGIASRDINGDGRPEVYLTSMGDQKLQIFAGTDGRPSWRDATYELGTTAHRPHAGADGRPSTGWHAQFGDVNNDGLDDIFVAKGNVEQMPVAAMDDPNSLLLQNDQGYFEEYSVEAGVASFSRSRGGALVDLNGDGRLDLVVANRRAQLEVYENATPGTGNWLSVEVSQGGHNRFAIGSFIELQSGERTIVREIVVGGGHASGQAGAEHFGLGEEKTARVRVVWPDGEASDWVVSNANTKIEIVR